MRRRAQPDSMPAVRFALAVAVFSGTTWFAAAAGAAEPELRASLSCRREVSPGRVQCELVITTGAGRLAWADALVVGVPEFTRPLRSRVGSGQALRRSERALMLPLSLAATRNGRGELKVEARAVICGAEGNRCTPLTRTAVAEVEVGARERR